MKKYKLNKNVCLKYDDVSDKYYAFCVNSGDHFALNRVGFFILTLLEKGYSIDEIINSVHKQENIDLNICKTDTINFLNKSKKIGIIAIEKEDHNYDKKRQD